jgi:energy-coupling factor transporter ATP-binding protein EcfA2
MTENPFFDTFNAKHKSDAEIASSFVPPPNTLERLIVRDHTVMSGPRGSGKTTLLKMLTLPALKSWEGDEADTFKSKIDFVSVFVAADRSWHGQLLSLTKQIPDDSAAQLLGMSAFTTHIFKAIISTFIDWEGLPRSSGTMIFDLLPKLDQVKEKQICKHLADLWMLKPRADTFVEMRTALSKRLADIGVLRNQMRFSSQAIAHKANEFLYVDYREGIRGAAYIHNHVSDKNSRRWSFLFDEMEVAPSFVQESLFSDLRGEVDTLKINYKLALAPFNKNFRNIFDEQGVSQTHDYSHVDLSFARKESGYEFSRRLCNLMLHQAGIDATVENMLGSSYFAFEDENLDDQDFIGSKYSADRPLGKVFRSLSDKDASFKAYLSKRNLDLNNITELNEQSLAKTFRKIRNVVVIREYFSRPSRAEIKVELLSSRSRKSDTLYSGNPSMLALTEGNPRSLINLFSPLVAQYKETRGDRKVSESLQADEIQKSIRIMRSLLKAVPHKNRRNQGKGLLPFLDSIGKSLHEGITATKFSDQPPLSFRVDRGVNPDNLYAVGKALNLGALIYIPDQDSEDVLSSVVGKRFRLNYLLAVHYKLPLSLDREIFLSSLLRGQSGDQQVRMDLPDGH